MLCYHLRHLWYPLSLRHLVCLGLKQLLEVIELVNVRLGILINYAMYCISCYRCRVPIYGNVQPILTFKSSDNTLRWDH